MNLQIKYLLQPVGCEQKTSFPNRFHDAESVPNTIITEVMDSE